ncbi:MAG: glutaredoxin 3 [Gammaproteobacteria bacterium]|jgi:glutaredoxin 3|nr:glutaredoxin 3 [Gammaproteobacteria bacterium]
MGKPAPVLVYAKPYCPYCTAAKALLREKGVTFEEIDISRDHAARERMVERSGRQTVPQIFIGERHIGGFDDLSALNQSGQLDPLLGLGR